MRNLKQETLEELKDIGKSIEDIVALNVQAVPETQYEEDDDYGVVYEDYIELEGYTPKKISQIIENDFDFDYNEGYGQQIVHGIILFNDGSWMVRKNYDGAEWWSYFKPKSVEDVKNYFKE
jgi:hypothetical protein